MKLAEALVARADAQKRLQQLQQRIALSARFQEGERPPEDPQVLLDEAERIAGELEDLIRRINRTNSSVEFDSGRSLSDALAERDVLSVRPGIFAGAAQAASVRQDRYSRSEVKFVTGLDVGELQRRIDDLSKRYREWEVTASNGTGPLFVAGNVKVAATARLFHGNAPAGKLSANRTVTLATS